MSTQININERPQIDFDKYLIDMTKPTVKPSSLFSIKESILFSMGNISVISGVAKSRKSYLAIFLVSQILNDNKSRILYFDTEQSEWHARQAANRVHRLMEWEENLNYPNFKYYFLTELGTEERKEVFFKAMDEYRPDFVILDGVRDLIKSINDESESGEIVMRLKKYASEHNTHICNILHTNKGDGNLRGWIGSEIQNKAESVLNIVPEKNISRVSGRFTKNIPFDDFYISINSDGLPEFCDASILQKDDGKLRNLFNELLPVTSCLSFADLRTKVMEKTGRAIRTSERYIKDATDSGIVVKNAANMYYSFDNNNSLNTDEQLPF